MAHVEITRQGPRVCSHVPPAVRRSTPDAGSGRGGGRALVAWLASLLLVIALFSWLGRGPLGGPPLSRPETWSPWLSRTDPVEATFALGRLLVLALAWYLAGATVLGALARALARARGRPRLVRLADALTVPTVRRVLDASLGLGLVTAVVTASVPEATRSSPVAALDRGAPVVTAAQHALRDGPPPTDPLWHLRPDLTEGRLPDRGEAGASRDVPGVPGPEPAGQPTGQDASDVDEGATGQDVSDVDEGATGADVSDVDEGAGGEDVSDVDGGATWEVQPGDHFWSIAERVVAGHLGCEPSDAQTAPYWRRLVDANRDALAHSGDPDLIYPGQRFRLPPRSA